MFKLNNIGFSNVKNLVLSNKLIFSGITITATGLLTIIAGSILRAKNSTWVAGNNQEWFDYLKEIYDDVH